MSSFSTWRLKSSPLNNEVFWHFNAMCIVIIMLQIKVREISTIRVDTRGPKVQKMVPEVLKLNQATSSLQIQFEDTKVVIRSRNSKKDRQYQWLMPLLGLIHFLCPKVSLKQVYSVSGLSILEYHFGFSLTFMTNGNTFCYLVNRQSLDGSIPLV